MSATRRGEAFDVATGRPTSHVRRELKKRTTTSWYQFACEFADMKWPGISAKHRKGVAESLVTVTCALLTDELPAADAVRFRSALLNWGFSTRRRGSDDQPEDLGRWLSWAVSHTRPFADLAKPEVIRQVLDAVATLLDGAQAAGRTTHRKKAVLTDALAYAVERKLLTSNPIDAVTWKAPKIGPATLDKAAVPNPTLARAGFACVSASTRLPGAPTSSLEMCPAHGGLSCRTRTRP